MNYFVLAAYGVALLLLQFPHDLIDHVNIHTRVFQPKIGASPCGQAAARALQFYFEYVLSVLVARAPHYYRVQHVYQHHVEDNGMLDSQIDRPLRPHQLPRLQPPCAAAEHRPGDGPLDLPLPDRHKARRAS